MPYFFSRKSLLQVGVIKPQTLNFIDFLDNLGCIRPNYALMITPGIVNEKYLLATIKKGGISHFLSFLLMN